MGMRQTGYSWLVHYRTRMLICGFFLVLLSISSFSLSAITSTKPEKKIAILLELQGAIGPTTRDYLNREFQKAANSGAKLIILRMDTPGGLLTSTHEIIRDILASPIPVVTYVAPSGSRAASAGTFILYASHFAAMAPGTNLGAATPVAIGGFGLPTNEKEQATKPSPEELKALNDASAYIRSLAQLRGRNVQWAERAVRQAESLAADEALRLRVIDIKAANIPDLLQQLNGRTSNVLGQLQQLDTEGMTVQAIIPDWKTKIMSILMDPNIAYILLLIGIYGLIFEFASPGLILPGVVGAICLLLGLYAFQLLPVNYVGLSLILLGIAFMITEAFIASFGVLGIGGVIAFVLGSFLLIQPDIPGFGISIFLIVLVSLCTAAFFFLVINMALRARARPIVSGREELIGMQTTIIQDDHGNRVRIRGELWQVKSSANLIAGQRVKVVKIEGLILWVQPL
jgi:membrane-bound serine protease (ClpP class)